MNAVVTLNLYQDAFPPNFRLSMATAAARWGVPYLEITEPLFPTETPGRVSAFKEKEHLDERLLSFDRVAYFDRDIVIRNDCPSPFDIVPKDHLGVVVDIQERSPVVAVIEQSSSLLSDLFDVSLTVKNYFNAGIMIFSPSVHKPLFDLVRKLREEVTDYLYDDNFHDQGLLNAGVLMLGMPIYYLPREFNRIGARVWSEKKWTGTMDAYVYHFCGPKDPDPMTAWQRVAGINWYDCSTPVHKEGQGIEEMELTHSGVSG